MFIKRPASSRGFTLMELMIATAIGSIVLAAIATFSLYTSRSFAAMSNYIDLNQKSMHALDIMTRELRQAQKITSISSDEINLIDVNGNALSFKYHGADDATYPRKVMMIGTSSAELLLEDCDDFNAVGFLRTPKSDGGFNKTTNPALVKMVQIDWECYRDVFLGDKRTTESVQTAKVVLRFNAAKTKS